MYGRTWHYLLCFLRLLYGLGRCFYQINLVVLQADVTLIGASLADGSIFTAGQAVWLSSIAGGVAAVWDNVLSPTFLTVHKKADEEIQ